MSISSARITSIETTSFITKDTYISNNFKEQEGNQGEAEFIRVGKGTKNVIAQTLLGLYDKASLPEGHNIESVQLCLYQYFAGKNAAPIDPFRINLISEDWNENVVARSKPKIGGRIKSFYLDSKEGKECVKFDMTEIEKLDESYGIIISGGTSSDRKERYFTSSDWLSKSRGVETKASSASYHPHWKILSSPSSNVIPVQGEIENPIAQTPKSNIVIISSCMVCLFLSMVGVYYWRRRMGESKEIYRYNSDSSRFESVEEFGSIHDAQLQEIFRMTEKNKALQRSARNSRSQRVSSDVDYDNTKRHETNNHYYQNEYRNTQGGNYNNKAMSQSTATTDLEENLSSLSSATGSINTTNVIGEQDPDPCSINKVCMRVIHRKGKIVFSFFSLSIFLSVFYCSLLLTLILFSTNNFSNAECDIDYVAPGVASVVDRQCTNNNLKQNDGIHYR